MSFHNSYALHDSQGIACGFSAEGHGYLENTWMIIPGISAEIFLDRGTSRAALVFGIMVLPIFRAVGIVWFAVNCFSAMTYGGRLAILFAGRKLLRSSNLR